VAAFLPLGLIIAIMQVEDTDAAQVVDPRVQTGNRDKRAKRAFNFVEEGTYVKQACKLYICPLIRVFFFFHRAARQDSLAKGVGDRLAFRPRFRGRPQSRRLRP